MTDTVLSATTIHRTAALSRDNVCVCLFVYPSPSSPPVLFHSISALTPTLHLPAQLRPLGSTSDRSRWRRQAPRRRSLYPGIVCTVLLVLLCRISSKVQIVAALPHVADAVADTADTRGCLMRGKRHGWCDACRSLHGTVGPNAVKVRVAHGLCSGNTGIGLVRQESLEDRASIRLWTRR